MADEASPTSPGEPARERDERRVLTAFFADIVGSTPLAERLDPEEFRLVVGEATSAMVRAVERYGGMVSALTGDGLLALFGAPVAREDDAERAVRAGLACIEEIADYAREVEAGWGIADFAVRVGITTGDTIVGTFGEAAATTYTAHGDAVNVAARLQAVADPQQVLVGPTTRKLAEHHFEWGERRNLELKGKSAPLEATPVLGIAAAPEPDFDQFDTPLVGRDGEVRRLQEAAGNLAEGRGGILFLTGEAGIGKSRLVAELHGLVRSSSPGTAVWLEGDCASYGEDTPYWPFRRILRHWLGVASDDPDLRVRVALRRSLDDLFGDDGADVYPYLASLLALKLEPEGRARLETLSPEALQYRTFEVIGQVLEQLATRTPVVLAVEDLHWADPTSTQLVEQLAAATERSPLLLVLSSRLEPDHRSWALRTDIHREFPHNTTELSLHTLPGVAERRILAALIGEGTLPEHVERQVLDAAEGNPFYLEELVRSLVDAGAVRNDNGVWVFDHAVPLDVPPTVERVILARTDRLQPSTREVLIAATVLGRTFTLPLLEAVAPSDGAAIGDSLHALQRLGFVREAGRRPEPEYRFAHALIHDAVYHTMLEADRIGLHERAARYLESRHTENLDEVVGLLARHWHAAGDVDKAVTYLTRAGDKARMEYALDEAIGHYRSLLPLLEDRGDRRQAALVLFKLALALHMTLRFGEADDVYQRAFSYWEDPRPAARSPGAVLRYVGPRTVRGPTPKSHMIGDIQMAMAVYDRLVEALPEQTIVPSLADRWTIAADGLRYTLHLRQGLRWSDGAPLTAHDVEYGIKRILDPDDPGMSVAIFFVIENALDYYLGNHDDPDSIGIRSLDDQTVEFILDAPAPYFMWVLNRPDAAPQPRHVLEAGDDGVVDRDVTSGPYRLLVKEDDSPQILERRDDYERPRTGNVARVEWHDLDDAVEQRYLDGELDLVTTGFGHLPLLHERFPDQEQRWPPAFCVYLAFDHGASRTANRDFRRALAHAIDREAVSVALPPSWRVATGGLVPPPLQGHTPDIVPSFDPERAQAVLASSGDDLSSVVLPTRPDPQEVQVLRVVAEGWRRVLGLETTVLEIDDLYTDASTWRAYGIVPLVWYPGYPDPEYFLRLLLHSASRSNTGGFSDPHYDGLVEAARQERSDRRRLEAFHEADRYAVAEQAAVIPLWYASNVSYTKPHVQGWWEFGKTWPNFADLVVGEVGATP